MPDTTSTIADHVWGTIVPVLEEYLAIPNVSMVFDPEWRSRGHTAEAVDLIVGWCRTERSRG